MWHSKALFAFSSSQISSCSHSGRMFGNESIVVFESLVEIDEVLDVGIAGIHFSWEVSQLPACSSKASSSTISSMLLQRKGL